MSSTGNVVDVATDPELAAEPSPRTARGTFVKGHSGNPLGKAKGTRNAITLQRLDTEAALRDFLRPKAQKILAKAVSMALEGNETMLKVLLDKTLSSLRTEDVGESKDHSVTLTINNLTATARHRRGEVIDVESTSTDEVNPTAVTIRSSDP